MPQAIPFAVAAITSAYGATVSALATVGVAALGEGAAIALATSAVNAGISAALGAAATALLAPKVGQSQGNPTDWVADPDAPIPFAFGRVGVAGNIVHRTTFGPDLMYQGFVTVLSGAGPINSFVGFTGDDQSVTFDGAGKANSSQWSGEMWMKTELGAQPASALVSPSGLKNSAALPAWGTGYKLSGKAAYMLVLGENSKRTAYPTGEPKPLWVIEGLKLWDPRLDSTYPGGSGSCRLNTPSTWVYSTNPILCGLKWALGLWEGPTGQGAPGVDYQVGGIGAKVEGIDVAAFVSAANISDANSWSVAAYPTSDDDKAQVLDGFLQAGGTLYAQKAGRISCIHRASARTSIVTISATDTAGPIEIDTAASRINRINTLRPRFWSEANRWQMTAIDEVTSSTYQTEDGGKRTRGLDFPFVPGQVQCGQLAALQIAHTREGITGTIPLKPHLQRIAPGDAFTITEAGFVLDGLKCLCLNTEYDPATGVHRVTFVSETDAKYAYALGQSPDAPESPTLTPVDPTVVTPPDTADWTVVIRPAPSGGGGQIPGFDLTGVVNNASAHRVVVETGSTGTGPWTQAYLGPPTAERIQITVDPNTTYYVSVSYFNAAGNQSTRTVYGPFTTGAVIASPTTSDTTPPAAPTSVALASTSVADAAGNPYVRITATWTAPGDTDLVGYDVEVTESGFTVVDRVSTTAWSREALTGRVYAIRVRAVDTSANVSGWTTSANITGASDTTAPSAPTSLAGTASLGSVFLTAAAPSASDTVALVFFENTTNNSSTAYEVARSNARPSGFVSAVRAGLPNAAVLYYWARAVDASGNASAFSSVATVTTPQVQVTDFASSIRPVELMSTSERTAATPTLGRQVYDTTLGRLYRGTGSIWTAAVPSTEITGTLTAAQIDTITAAQLTGQITSTQISSNAITTPLISAGAVVTASLAAGAVTAGTIAAGAVTTTALAAGSVTTATLAAGAVTAATIAADTITAGQIAAGAISAAEIAADAITTDKLGALSVTAAKIAAGTITAEKITAGTLTGDRFNTATSLPGTITVGSTGVSIGTVESRAADPAARVNAGSTVITPGLIQISGSTTLADWRQGGDTTKIAGGSISANTIAANKLTIGNRGIAVIGCDFQWNGSVLSWKAGFVLYPASDGSITSSAITAGSTSWLGGAYNYISWTQGGTTLAASVDDWPAIMATNNKIIFCTWGNGSSFVANFGGTIVHGDNITTGSINANRIVAGSITADRIAAGTVTADRLVLGGIGYDRLAYGSSGRASIYYHTPAYGVPANAWTTVSGVGITPAVGSPVTGHFSMIVGGSASGTVTVRVVRVGDSTVVWGHGHLNAADIGVDTRGTIITGQFFDSTRASAGRQQYDVQIYGYSISLGVSHRTISLRELARDSFEEIQLYAPAASGILPGGGSSGGGNINGSTSGTGGTTGTAGDSAYVGGGGIAERLDIY